MWFPWWLRHGAMDPLEGTLYGRLSTDLTSEFTHFNPGIRLRKGKQSAFFSTFHTVVVEVLNHWPLQWGNHHFYAIGRAWRRQKHFFFSAVLKGLQQQSIVCEGNRHVLFLQVWSSWYFWWGKPVVHPIREDLIAVSCPIWVDRPRSCNGNNVRLL